MFYMRRFYALTAPKINFQALIPLSAEDLIVIIDSSILRLIYHSP